MPQIIKSFVSWLSRPHVTSNLDRQSLIYSDLNYSSTVKLGNKERFDKEQIGIKEPFPVINLPFTS